MSETKEDYLEVDQPVPGQNFCCISFISPESVIKQKELYYFHKYMNQRCGELEKSLEETLKKAPEEVKNMIIAIYSDMQIDDELQVRYSPYNNKVMSDKIDNMYMDAGYNRPHLLFWNLRSTDGFPMISKQSNITALSGYNSTLLNVFCNKGIEGLKEYTPAKSLENLLNNDRYNKMEQDVVMFINNY